MLSSIKQGETIDVYYTGFKGDTGLTVEGQFRSPNGTLYSPSPISFTHLANGLYKATITPTNNNGWHIGYINATDAGKSRPGIFKFRVVATDIVEVQAQLATVDGKVDGIVNELSAMKGLGFAPAASLASLRALLDEMAGTGFATATDSNKAIADAVSAITTAVSSIQGSVRSYVLTPATLAIPSSGNTRYRITAYNYGSDGGMEDFDAAPTVVVNGSDGNTYTARLFDSASGGLASSTMQTVSTGVYETFVEIQDSDTAGLILTFNVTGVENGETYSFAETSEVNTSIASAGVAMESTLDDMKGNLFSTATDSLRALRLNLEATKLEITQKTGGAYDQDTDSLEALSESIANVIDNLIPALSNQITATQGTGFDTAVHSMVELNQKIEDSITYSGNGAF